MYSILSDYITIYLSIYITRPLYVTAKVTLVHITREEADDSPCGCCVEVTHGATEHLHEHLVVYTAGSLQCCL